MARSADQYRASVTKSDLPTDVEELIELVERKVGLLLELQVGDRYNSYAQTIVALKDLEVIVDRLGEAYDGEEEAEGDDTAAEKAFVAAAQKNGLVVKRLTLKGYERYTALALEKHAAAEQLTEKGQAVVLAIKTVHPSVTKVLAQIEDTGQNNDIPISISMYTDPEILLPVEEASIDIPAPGQPLGGSNAAVNLKDAQNTDPTKGISPAAANGVVDNAVAAAPKDSNFTTNPGDILKRTQELLIKAGKKPKTPPPPAVPAAAPAAAPAAKVEPAPAAAAPAAPAEPVTKAASPAEKDAWPDDLNDAGYLDRMKKGDKNPGARQPTDW